MKICKVKWNVGTWVLALLTAVCLFSCSDGDGKNGDGGDGGGDGSDAQTMSVHVAKAGTLGSLIDGGKRASLKRLKVSGELNGTDLRLLRRMAALSDKPCEVGSSGKLQYLDMEQARIVSGGEKFADGDLDAYKAQADVVGYELFAYSPVLQEVVLPATATLIDVGAFVMCENLKSITIGRNMKEIRQGAFSMCPSLKTLRIKDLAAWCSVNRYDKILSDGGNLYVNDVLQTTLTIPDGVEEISADAFAGSSVQVVNLPSSLRKIDTYAFLSCSALHTINFPLGLEEIGEYAFRYCGSLKTIDLPSSLKSVGMFAFEETGLESFALPSSVATVGSGLLSGCKKLRTVTLPDAVELIENGAFMNCTALENVHIGKGIKQIGSRAFDYCTGLRQMTIDAAHAPNADSSDTFFGVSLSSVRLYVPSASLNSYRSRAPWSSFSLTGV